MKLKYVEFYFIRHGETDWNCEGRCMGQKDIPLNNHGVAQARKAATILRGSPIKSICHSPLQRAKKTAELINETLNCPMVEIDSLKECSWGTHEGKLKRRDHFDQWRLGNPPEGAEDHQKFIIRALMGVNEALQYPTPLIISHGGVYWAIQSALGQSHNISNAIQNCAAYYHKPLSDLSAEWYIQPVDNFVYEEPFET